MKALLLTEYKQMSVTEVDEPPVGPDDVLVQVEACGICGSDIHGYDGSTGRNAPPPDNRDIVANMNDCPVQGEHHVLIGDPEDPCDQ